MLWLGAVCWLLVSLSLGAADPVMPTLMLPFPKDHPHALDFDVRNVTREMLAVNVPTEASNEQCREDSLLYTKEALAARPWALRMYDSSTKVPDGLLTGNVVQLGNFDECLGTHAMDANGTGLFWGQYCLAGLSVDRLYNEPNNNTATRPMPKDANLFSNHLLAALAGHRLQWAVCLPASCSAHDLEHHLQHSMPQLLLPEGEPPRFALNASVLPSNCYRARAVHLDEADWAIILTLSCIFGIVVASTAYDLTHPEAAPDALMKAFSIPKNARALFATKAHGQMGSVNGIKFLSMAWVMLFHKYCVMVETPNVNSDVVLEGLKYDWTQMPISNGGSMAVNSFFVVGGLLLTHGFIRDRVAGRPFSLFKFYIYRYIRLTPVYAVTVGIYATILYHFGNGPLWNPVMAMHRENCRHHWWRNLLYINNYQPVTSELCVVQTWYLAADMQLYWLSPLLLWPLWRWPRAGKGLLLVLLTVPLASTFWITYTRRYPWADDKEISNEIRNSYFPLIHASAYARAAPFLVGVGLAWALHASRKSKIRLPKILVAVCWVLLLAVSWIITYALYIYYKRDHEYNVWEAACFQSLHPLGWGLAVAWLIYACERGYAGPVRHFLCWRWWQPLSRLTYSAYLVHFAVFYFGLGVTRAPGHYTHYNVLHIVFGDLAVVLVLATVFALAFELPVLNIDRVLLKPSSNSGKKPNPPSRPSHSVTIANPAATVVEEGEVCNGTASGAVNPAFESDVSDVSSQVTKM